MSENLQGHEFSVQLPERTSLKGLNNHFCSLSPSFVEVSLISLIGFGVRILHETSRSPPGHIVINQGIRSPGKQTT